MTIITDKINYLWLDVETTGLDPVKNDVIQLAAIPVINGQRQDITFNEYCQPFDWNTVDDGALRVNNITREQLATFQSPTQMIAKLVKFAKQFNVKFTIAGYNVQFDKDFLASAFKKADLESEFTAIFNSDIRDTYKKAKKLKSQLNTQNLKLGTLCKHFDIEINAHDALSDISGTMDLDKILSEMLGDVEIHDHIIEHVVDDSISFREPVQLHCHSKYSHTDSITDIRDMIEWCIKTGTPGFSFVDHGMAASLHEMIRVPDIIKSINKSNGTSYEANAVTPIPGVGLHIEHNGQRFYLNAWAINNTGYKNLIKLASEGWANRCEISKVEFPLLALEQVFARKDGIIFGIPGVNGPMTQLLVEKRVAEIENLILNLKANLDIRLELASIDVYKYYDSDIGFMSYNVKGGNIQRAINRLYFLLSKKHNIKCVPVTDSHYIDPADKTVQECISKNSFKDHRYFSESRHQLRANEMYTILKSHLEDHLNEDIFNSMIDNTYEIAELASTIEIKYDYHLPKIDIPESIAAKTSDYDMQTYYLTMQKIKEHGRWNDSPEYVERFKKEIDVVMKNETLNFLPYFLVYEDICAFARSSGLLQNIARGSAGGSLLSYYLKIIHVDPVAADLPFERFLSHARIRAGSFPDIDLDIADRARPLVMAYLQEKYRLGFAQMATFSKMKTKNAIKDAMAALYGRNRNDPEVKAICATIPDSPQGIDEYDFLYGYTDSEGEEHQGQVQSNEMLANFFAQRPEIESMVKKLIGTIRGWSRHASAFVISTVDLADGRVPTMVMSDKDLGDILVTQYDAPMVEKSGLVKADILGLKTLTMVSDCVKLIKDMHGVDLLEEERGVPLIYRLPDEDKAVFTDFYRRDTDSSFQFNSDVIKNSVSDFTPTKKEHLSIMTALMRPGAMDAQMDFVRKDSNSTELGQEGRKETLSAAKFYISVRKGDNDPYFIHSDLKPILEDTYGVIVYQEQVMAILVQLCGYSLEETDSIRSAIAKKKQEVIMAAFERIRLETAKRGWTEEQSNALCQQILAFSRYSFNKSHSYAYAELGYITMYLKHYYPLEWWCSVLNTEDKEDRIRKYIAKLSEKITAPSLKHPSKLWAIKNGKIAAPVSSIKGIGPKVVDELVAKGPFVDLPDYIEKINHSKVNIGSMSALIKSRAADDMMDESIEDYIERRKTFMDTYVSLRKSKTAFKPEMYEMDPLSIFLDERELSESFNRNLLSSEEIQDIIIARWPGVRKTGNKAFPLVMGGLSDDSEPTYIASDLRTVEELFANGKLRDRKIAMIGLYDRSETASGISKKSGRPWKKLGVFVSDGFGTLECTMWDRDKPLRYKQNSIVYVYGDIKSGWKSPISMVLSDVQEVQ